MRTPLKELNLQHSDFTNSGQCFALCSTLTPSLCKLGLQVRFDWTAAYWAVCPGPELRGTEGQGWNVVINNDNEVSTTVTSIYSYPGQQRGALGWLKAIH